MSTPTLGEIRYGLLHEARFALMLLEDIEASDLIDSDNPALGSLYMAISGLRRAIAKAEGK